jgi:hypothetical protein
LRNLTSLGKPEETKPLSKPKRKCKDDIKMDLKPDENLDRMRLIHDVVNGRLL